MNERPFRLATATRVLRDERNRRSERAAGAHVARGYAGSRNLPCPEEPSLGVPVTFVSEVSVEGTSFRAGRRANL